MAKPKEHSVKSSVFVSPEVYQTLKARAQDKGTTVSGLVRMIVLEWLKKKETLDI